MLQVGTEEIVICICSLIECSSKKFKNFKNSSIQSRYIVIVIAYVSEFACNLALIPRPGHRASSTQQRGPASLARPKIDARQHQTIKLLTTPNTAAHRIHMLYQITYF